MSLTMQKRYDAEELGEKWDTVSDIPFPKELLSDPERLNEWLMSFCWGVRYTARVDAQDEYERDYEW